LLCGARGGDGAASRVLPVPLLRRVRGPTTAAAARWRGALGRRGAAEEVPQIGYGFLVVDTKLIGLHAISFPFEFEHFCSVISTATARWKEKRRRLDRSLPVTSLMGRCTVMF
jgi:hypothetical protein